MLYSPVPNGKGEVDNIKVIDGRRPQGPTAMEFQDIALAVTGIALGGFLKGATGAGAPVVGVPVLALVVGVQQSVAIFAVLNLISNIWQAWAFQHAIEQPRLVRRFAISGCIGALLGTFLLASLSTEILMAGLAMIVFLYIGLRLARPGWQISRETGERISAAAGFAGGVMQGAGGLSAPVSVTFLNAMRLERAEFIGTISVFFLMMSVTQVPGLIAVGLLDLKGIGLGLLACIPLFGAMPIGAIAARRVSKEVFDRLILIFLAIVATRLLFIVLI